MTQITNLPNQATLPVSNPTKSYWHTEPNGRLLGHRTTEELPDEADVVIVGTGITGAFVAREIVGAGKNVVCLEAREVCWGATGRNGGRCEPLVFVSKSHVARFEVATYNFLSELVQDNNVSCDWKTIKGIYALKSGEEVQLAKRRIEQLELSHPDLAELVTLVEDAEELARLEVSGAKGAVIQERAASCWPYKLVCWILEGLLDTGRLNLQTQTPVEHVQRREDSWIVHTQRGQIFAKQVVIATNGYTSYLLPKMTGLITPVRGHIAATAAPKGSTPLRYNHAWTSKKKGDADESDDYLIQRADGDIVVGGERNCTLSGDWGVSNDAGSDPYVSGRIRQALHGNINLFPGQDEPEELDAKMEWTGIMGFSSDSSPWVGQVPESLGGGEGLWLCAGYTGHGMPVAARCGVAVGGRLLEQDSGVDIPKEWEITEERVEKGRGMGRALGTLVKELKTLVEEQDI